MMPLMQYKKPCSLASQIRKQYLHLYSLHVRRPLEPLHLKKCFLLQKNTTYMCVYIVGWKEIASDEEYVRVCNSNSPRSSWVTAPGPSHISSCKETFRVALHWMLKMKRNPLQLSILASIKKHREKKEKTREALSFLQPHYILRTWASY